MHLVTAANPESTIHPIGHLHGDLSLRELYSAADAMVIPARQKDLPNSGVEAHACATPVVAFHTGGRRDIDDHQRTRYYAKAFGTEGLAKGIPFLVAQRKRGIWAIRLTRGGQAVEL